MVQLKINVTSNNDTIMICLSTVCIEMGLNASCIVLQYCAIVNVVSWHCRIHRAS